MSNMPGKASLLERLGGEPAIVATVHEFYKRLLADDQLAHYFDGVDMEKLKKHQIIFFSRTFSIIARKFNVSEQLYKNHKRLFRLGLGSKEFDLVVGHLVGALDSLGVPKDLIDEAGSIIVPIRSMFVKGHERATMEMAMEQGAEKAYHEAPDDVLR
jgi:hemoglobin